MDIMTWFEVNVLKVFIISCLVVIAILIVRGSGLEEKINRFAEKKASTKAKQYAKSHPDETEDDIQYYKNGKVASYKNLLSLPYALISIISIITLVISVAIIWVTSQGEEVATIDVINNWIAVNGTIILAVLIVAYLFTSMMKIIIPKIIHNFMNSRNRRKNNLDVEFEKRGKTISNVLVSTINAIVWVVAVCIVLSKIGLNITPLLASAGVVGIAVSLGAQSLIKDIISGFFILLEGHYNEGDYITIAGVSGNVVDINFRRTTLRSTDGILYSIPNGQIAIAANFTNETSKARFKVPVDYSSNIDDVERVINEVGEELANDPDFKDSIKTPIQFVRVDNFGDSSIDILVSGDTLAGAQWTICGEYRRRLKKAFDENGIEIPFAHTNVIVEGNPNKPEVNLKINKE